MTDAAPRFRNVVALAGGVGGAKLVDGLARALPAGALTIVVNTGDDFSHLGLRICPDIDTITYTLAGIAHRGQGWGIEGETFEALARVKLLGGEGWFALGDKDIGTHLVRTERLRRGERLTDVTADLARAQGVATRVLPMSDGPRRTLVETRDHGTLEFQEWLVARRAAPRVRALYFEGDAAPTPEVLGALDDADLVVIAPSNPYVSIDPIVSLEGVRERLARRPVIGVSPIVRGQAVKGPLATMIPDLAGAEPSAAAVARHYGRLLGAFVVEHGDDDGCPVRTFTTRTIMKTPEDREALARAVLGFAAEAFG